MDPVAAESTPERIQRIATALFAEKGYHATGVQELSDAVGLGRGALYHHIGSKENVLFDIIDTLVRHALEQGRAAVRSETDPERKLVLLASRLLSSLAAEPSAWQVTERDTDSLSEERRGTIAVHRSEYEELWRAVLDEGAARKLWRAVSAVQLRGVLGMFHHSYVWLRPDGPLTIDAVADRMVSVVLTGIRTTVRIVSAEEFKFSVGEVPIVHVLGQLASTRPDDPCFTIDGATLSYEQLDRRSNRMARAFEQKGLGVGDFVTIKLPNSIQNIVSIWAALKVGAVPNPISWRLTDREFAEIVELANATLVIGGDPRAIADRPFLPDGYEPSPDVSDAPLPREVVSPIMKAPTSGGSTGRPKLILFGTPAVVNVDAPPYGYQQGGTMLVPGPLYHNAPLTTTLMGIAYGNHVVSMPAFDPAEALRLIQRHGVTWAFFVPTMLQRIWRLPEAVRTSHDLSTLKRLQVSGAAVPPWLKEAWIGWIGADAVVEVYGTTEGVAYTMATGREPLERPGTVGKVVFGEMKILDEDGNELPPGAVGEIFMRNDLPVNMFEYVGATARERDGWTSFGDLGWFDEDGYLFLADRMLDKIVSGGANIYPAEVEAALSEHPDVLTCVVIGLPHDDLGHVVHALVQTRSTLTDDDLLQFLRGRLVSYKLPRTFEYSTEPVRDDAGKVRRSALSAERSPEGSNQP